MALDQMQPLAIAAVATFGLALIAACSRAETPNAATPINCSTNQAIQDYPKRRIP